MDIMIVEGESYICYIT